MVIYTCLKGTLTVVHASNAAMLEERREWPVMSGWRYGHSNQC